ncbi:uncharacterized protein LOC129572174, partial [Sitodiplosis mosellana]|uniref:uncharacterized protein LOC129572174 n=1 Tax=Sitodiplosis mosellana TaxID=263140 RepID=UPI0024448C3C
MVSGPDGIPNIFVKECTTALLKPITHMLKKSLDTGFVPEIWKSSFVRPVHKSGVKAKVKNYRGVALHTLRVFDSMDQSNNYELMCCFQHHKDIRLDRFALQLSCEFHCIVFSTLRVFDSMDQTNNYELMCCFQHDKDIRLDRFELQLSCEFHCNVFSTLRFFDSMDQSNNYELICCFQHDKDIRLDRFALQLSCEFHCNVF